MLVHVFIPNMLFDFKMKYIKNGFPFLDSKSEKKKKHLNLLNVPQKLLVLLQWQWVFTSQFPTHIFIPALSFQLTLACFLSYSVEMNSLHMASICNVHEMVQFSK